MNGSMGLVSESGVGSRFWVDLPEGTTAPAVRKRLLSLCFVGNDEATLRCLEHSLAGLVQLSHGLLSHCLAQLQSDTAPDIMLIDCDALGDDLVDALRATARGGRRSDPADSAVHVPQDDRDAGVRVSSGAQATVGTQ
jgi:hypothetical protein